MPQFIVRTPDQLPSLLQAFRKEAGLTQEEVALRLGVSQQTYSAMERNADRVGAARLLRLFNIFGVEVALGKSLQASAAASSSADKPAW
ncbi:MAG TPA: helix-turn-helix transcriptional regulator [Roseateles sp.]|uniref:helix-turn-helix domain-containing protein n=1 Tax=Roseateles sp. TaxID=1971397 RepID=UPI002ED7F55C